jgi:hypothetical protein
MRNFITTLKFAALALALTVLGVTGASAFTQKVKDACAGDYQNFCSQYEPETAALRSCFESNRKGLTKTCINALVDAGEVPARYLKK